MKMYLMVGTFRYYDEVTKREEVENFYRSISAWSSQGAKDKLLFELRSEGYLVKSIDMKKMFSYFDQMPVKDEEVL